MIKFSHRYNKMPPGFGHSKLIDVIPTDLADLSNPFRAYDTTFTEDGWSDTYPLPAKGAYMILMLLTESCEYQGVRLPGQLWTTIRSQKGKGGIDKLSYYKNKIGEIAECRVIA